MNTTQNAPKGLQEVPALDKVAPTYGPGENESTKDYASRILGNGQYHNLAREFMSDVRRIFGLNYRQAEKCGIQYQVDLGRYLKENPISGINIGKANKDMLVTLRPVMDKVKGVHLTPCLMLAKLVTLIDGAKVYGLSEIGHEYKLTPAIEEFLGA